MPVRERSSNLALAVAAVVLAACAGASALWPAGAAAWRVVQDGGLSSPTTSLPTFDWFSLARTAWYAALIGVIASVLAFPGAWWARGVLGSGRVVSGRARLGLALGIVPLLLPSYLAYAGWGLLRGPGSSLGDWIAQREPWVSVAAGRVLAVWGMALWVWPLAALVQGSRFARIAEEQLELIRMEGGAGGGLSARLRLVAPGFALSMLVVGVVMTGSTIPLHVAQVETYAIHLWRVLQLVESRAGIYVAAVPLVALALGAGAAVALAARARARRQDRAEVDEQTSVREARPVWAVAALFVWMLSAPAPALLFALSLRQWRSVPDFWRTNAAAIRESIVNAGVVGALGVVLALAAAYVVFARPGRGEKSSVQIVLWVASALVIGAGLAPGVILGSAYGEALAPMRAWLWSSPVGGGLPIWLAHFARYGWIAALIGVAVGVSESRASRQMRLAEAGSGFRAFAAVVLRPSIGALAGIFLVLGCLSLQEIESTIMVQTPGSQTLAQVLLDALHFSRDEQLSAGMLNLLGIGFVGAVAGAWLVGPVVGLERRFERRVDG